MIQNKFINWKQIEKYKTLLVENFNHLARTHRKIVIGVTVLIMLVVAILITIGLQNQRSIRSSANNENSAAIPDVGPLNLVVLFYISEDGTKLVRTEQAVEFGENTLARARIITEAQLALPPTPLLSPIPKGTVLRALYLTDDGNAFVDLSAEVTLAHPGGSLDELFTVYALVNALTVNLAEISAVQILIEGQEVDTLAGHVDLRRPLAINMKWVELYDSEIEDGVTTVKN